MARATSIATTEESLHRNIQWAFSMLASEDKVDYLQASLSEKKSISDNSNSDRVMAHPAVEDSKQESLRDVLAPLYVYPSMLLDAEWGEIVRVLSVGIIGANSIKRRGFAAALIMLVFILLELVSRVLSFLFRYIMAMLFLWSNCRKYGKSSNCFSTS